MLCSGLWRPCTVPAVLQGSIHSLLRRLLPKNYSHTPSPTAASPPVPFPSPFVPSPRFFLVFLQCICIFLLRPITFYFFAPPVRFLSSFLSSPLFFLSLVSSRCLYVSYSSNVFLSPFFPSLLYYSFILRFSPDLSFLATLSLYFSSSQPLPFSLSYFLLLSPCSFLMIYLYSYRGRREERGGGGWRGRIRRQRAITNLLHIGLISQCLARSVVWIESTHNHKAKTKKKREKKEKDPTWLRNRTTMNPNPRARINENTDQQKKGEKRKMEKKYNNHASR